jgi:hypothetical protein
MDGPRFKCQLVLLGLALFWSPLPARADMLVTSPAVIPGLADLPILPGRSQSATPDLQLSGLQFCSLESHQAQGSAYNLPDEDELRVLGLLSVILAMPDSGSWGGTSESSSFSAPTGGIQTTGDGSTPTGGPPNQVPEPASLVLGLCGLAGMVMLSRRRRRRSMLSAAAVGFAAAAAGGGTAVPPRRN